MKREIERKFLVDAKKLPTDLQWESVRQGYLSFQPAVRVRLWRGQGMLTIKSEGTSVRDEWEYPIPVADAEGLLALCGQNVIEKDRALTDFDGHEWTVDRFHGKLDGLIVAEVELNDLNEPVAPPPWVSGEVTGDERYMNTSLVRAEAPPRS